MKKLILLITVCVFFAQCATSDSGNGEEDPTDDGGQQQTNDFVFSIFNNDIFGTGTTAIIYLTNESGQILAQENFVTDQETTLVSVGNKDLPHDLVFFFDFVGIDGKRRKNVFILEDIAEGSYQYGDTDIAESNNDGLQVSLFNVDKRPFYITSQDRVVLSPYSSSNGGTIDLSTVVGVSSNLNGTYLALRRNIDSFQRYYWDATPPISDPEEIDYTQLPLLDNIVSLSAPAGYDIGSIEINGYTPNNQSDIGHRLFRFGFSGFNARDAYGVPDGIFNRYSIEVLYGIPNITHRLVKASNTPFTSIPVKTLSLDVNNTSLQAFSATTSGDYDSFLSIYEYDDVSANTFYRVRIYGKKSAEITFNHRFLMNDLLGSGLNINNLAYQTIFLRNYDGVTGYNDFFEQYLRNAPYDIPRRLNFESVSTF